VGGAANGEHYSPDDLAPRIALLEEHMRRVLLIVGAAGTILAEARRDEGDE
jgi:hypothetical protein